MKKISHISFVAMSAVLLSTISAPVFAAQSIGDIANNLANSFTSVGGAVQAFCWVMAFVIGCASAFKFAAYARDTEREKLSTPFLLMFVAALFFAIPMVLDTGVKSVWGDAPVKQSQHF